MSALSAVCIDLEAVAEAEALQGAHSLAPVLSPLTCQTGIAKDQSIAAVFPE